MNMYRCDQSINLQRRPSYTAVNQSMSKKESFSPAFPLFLRRVANVLLVSYFSTECGYHYIGIRSWIMCIVPDGIFWPWHCVRTDISRFISIATAFVGAVLRRQLLEYNSLSVFYQSLLTLFFCDILSNICFIITLVSILWFFFLIILILNIIKK